MDEISGEISGHPYPAVPGHPHNPAPHNRANAFSASPLQESTSGTLMIPAVLLGRHFIAPPVSAYRAADASH